MKDIKPRNPYIAYLIACQFKTVANEFMDSLYLYPTVVNASLACELFLKSLVMLQDREQEKTTYIEVHSLKYLYDCLNIETKEKIKALAGIYGFDSFIEEAKLAFEEWRYAYEHKKLYISIYDILRLADALQSILNERLGKIDEVDTLPDEELGELIIKTWYEEENVYL